MSLQGSYQSRRCFHPGHFASHYIVLLSHRPHELSDQHADVFLRIEETQTITHCDYLLLNWKHVILENKSKSIRIHLLTYSVIHNN